MNNEKASGGNGNPALYILRLTADEKKLLKAFLSEGLVGEEAPFKHQKVP
jgi:hypothetical protein